MPFSQLLLRDHITTFTGKDAGERLTAHVASYGPKGTDATRVLTFTVDEHEAAAYVAPADVDEFVQGIRHVLRLGVDLVVVFDAVQDHAELLVDVALFGHTLAVHSDEPLNFIGADPLHGYVTVTEDAAV